LGDYEGAKKGFSKLLEINKRTYGEYHPLFAKILMNLSNALLNLGDYEGAKEGFSKALDINKRTYGKEHPQYAKSLMNLSMALENLK
jgi:tetratricopeptide (TPR) repeat protein